MGQQVFLGGACGATDWRRRIAIPLLEQAGITYYDPQLGIGEWTPACEAAEMRAKDDAEVLLYVVSSQTRGVATCAEAAYALGSDRAVALAVADVGLSDLIDGKLPTQQERDDLNRGRIFVRTMARSAGVPVFENVESAVRHAILLIQSKQTHLTVETVRAVLADVAFKQSEFLVEPCDRGFLIQIQAEVPCAVTGEPQLHCGRKWHLSDRATPSDIVRTAFKAVVTWEEHEARENFRYRGVPVFGPHFEVDDLIDLAGPTVPSPGSNPSLSNSAESRPQSRSRANHP
jgi:hypothetical protein